MITITLKGIPKDVHQALKKRAATHGRSLNTEAIAALKASVSSQPAAVEAVIQKAQTFRNSLKFKVTAADLKRFKEEGRA